MSENYHNQTMSLRYRSTIARPRTSSPDVRPWTAAQWAAMRSPHRVHLLAALEALGEGTLAEVSVLTGRSRQSVHPHLKAMVVAGIIGTSMRTVHGRDVATYRFLPERIVASVNQATGFGLRQAADISARALQDAQARCHRWGRMADRRPIDLAINPEAVTSVCTSWLDAAQRRKFNDLLRQAMAVLREGCATRKGRRTFVLIYHFPDYTARETRAQRGAAKPRQR